MLYRILYGVSQNNYYLISSQDTSHQEKLVDGDKHNSLSGRCYPLASEPTIACPNYFGITRICNFINLLLHIFFRTKNILKILHSEPNTSAIIACTGVLVDMPAAFLASRVAHIPFFAYIFDDYVFQWTGKTRLFAKMVAPLIFKGSTGIIGPNEFICEEYKQRYHVKSTLVRNPYANVIKESYHKWPAERDNIKIVYTGAIYHANYDCFLNLIRAMELLNEYHLQLHIYTAQAREQLERQLIKGQQVFIHSHVAYNDILKKQYKADILFLPLAFESSITEVIRTSAPGKMGEYMASGRPILAHVPSDSFVAYYFNKYQCGLIVDQNAPHKLAAGIKRMIVDNNLRGKIIENSRRQVQLDFGPELARSSLIALLQQY